MSEGLICWRSALRGSMKTRKSRAGLRLPKDALNDAFCRSVKQDGKHADGKGLYLVVTDGGAGKRWLCRLSARGERHDLGLGTYPDVKLGEARQRAEELRKVARDGEDVVAFNRRHRQKIVPVVKPTFADTAKAMHKHIAPTLKNQKHAHQWMRTMEEYAFPKFGDLPVDEVKTEHVVEVLREIWVVKHETARRVRQRIRAVLDWARAEGKRTGDNPVDGASKGLAAIKKRPKHHEALPHARMPDFLTALAAANTSPSVRLGIEFTILTAARVSEVRFAKKAEIDLVARVWRVPAERTKSGREHIVPLSARALEVVKAAMQTDLKSDLIFPSPERKNKALSENTFTKIAQGLDFGSVTMHGFRSSFRDWAGEKTHYPRELAEFALAHVVRDQTEAAYARSTLIERRIPLMEDWSLYCYGLPSLAENRDGPAKGKTLGVIVSAA